MKRYPMALVELVEALLFGGLHDKLLAIKGPGKSGRQRSYTLNRYVFPPCNDFVQQLKQGMIQSLLTGQIRLVKPQGN